MWLEVGAVGQALRENMASAYMHRADNKVTAQLVALCFIVPWCSYQSHDGLQLLATCPTTVCCLHVMSFHPTRLQRMTSPLHSKQRPSPCLSPPPSRPLTGSTAMMRLRQSQQQQQPISMQWRCTCHPALASLHRPCWQCTERWGITIKGGYQGALTLILLVFGLVIHAGLCACDDSTMMCRAL